MGIVTAAVFQTFITQHQNYVVQDDISNIQQSARASIDELTRQIRMAGYKLPLGMAYLQAANTNPDTITVSYKNDNCDGVLTVNMSATSSDIVCGAGVSCFYSGQWAYIYHPDSGGGEFFQITNVNTGANALQHASALSKKYVHDAIVISVARIQFYVDNTTDPNHPSLVLKLFGKTPQVYAENVVNLQFRYRLKNGLVVDVPADIDDVRQVIFDVTARSNTPDTDKHGAKTYRTRVYSSEVSLRNRGV
jgi:Tfp pilus assembly protein PilW